MERIRDNVNYEAYAKCSRCDYEYHYHVTDIKGVSPKYVLCPICATPIKISD